MKDTDSVFEKCDGNNEGHRRAWVAWVSFAASKGWQISLDAFGAVGGLFDFAYAAREPKKEGANGGVASFPMSESMMSLLAVLYPKSHCFQCAFATLADDLLRGRFNGLINAGVTLVEEWSKFLEATPLDGGSQSIYVSGGSPDGSKRETVFGDGEVGCA